MELDRVSSMREPLATMPRGDPKAGPASDAAEGEGISRSVATDLLFLESPAGLDRIEVVRIGRKVDAADSTSRAEWDHSLVVVCQEIVEDEHFASHEARKQLLREPFDEDLLARTGEHRGEEDPAGQPQRAEQGEVLAPVHRRALDVDAALLHPGVAASHRAVEPGLIEEDQLARCHAADQAPEGFSLGDHVGTELLERTKKFFFTTYPARYSARLMLEAWRRCLPRRPRLYSAVISPALASGRRARMASSSCREISEGVPPLLSSGFTCPRRRNCQTQRLAVASPTQNRRARRMYPPSPRSCASTSRCLNSIGWASAMSRLDQTPIADASLINSTEQWG